MRHIAFINRHKNAISNLCGKFVYTFIAFPPTISICVFSAAVGFVGFPDRKRNNSERRKIFFLFFWRFLLLD